MTHAPTSIINLTRGVYRLIYAGAIFGRRINAVSEGAELVFWRLLLIADDFGAFSLDPVQVRTQALPRRDISPADLSGRVAELADVGLIRTYAVDGETYGEIVDWEATQKPPRNGRRVQRCPRPLSGHAPTRPAPSAGSLGEFGGDPGSLGENGCKSGSLGASHSHSHSQSHSQSQCKITPLDFRCTEGAGGIPDPEPPEFDHPPVPSEHRESAIAALSRWSNRCRRVGLVATRNEFAELDHLLGLLAQESPVVRSGAQVPRTALLPAAVDVLMARGVGFKHIKFALGCVRNEIDAMALEVLAPRPSEAFETDRASAAALEKVKARRSHHAR